MRTQIKIGAAVAAVAFGLLSQSAKAAITNGDFGTGDLTGFTSIGDASVQGSDFNPPSPATNIGFITNRTSNAFGTSVASSSQSALENFAHLTAGTLSGTSSGSELQTTSFTATAGDVISFNYNFLTNEPTTGGNADSAFYSVLLPTQSTTGTIVSLGNPALLISPINQPSLTPQEGGIYSFLDNGDGHETGNQLTSFIAPTTGLYTLTFGVLNATNDLNSSGLLVTNLADTAATGVPLPAAVFLAPLGMAVAGRYGKKFRRKTA